MKPNARRKAQRHTTAIISCQPVLTYQVIIFRFHDSFFSSSNPLLHSPPFNFLQPLPAAGLLAFLSSKSGINGSRISFFFSLASEPFITDFDRKGVMSQAVFFLMPRHRKERLTRGPSNPLPSQKQILISRW